MSDPYVREIGRLEDSREVVPLAVGVDYDSVTIGCGAIRWTLSAAAAEEFAAMFISACWQAARHNGQLTAPHGSDQCRDALFSQAREGGGDDLPPRGPVVAA